MDLERTEKPVGELRVTSTEPVAGAPAPQILKGGSVIRIKFSCCPTFKRSFTRSPGLPVPPTYPPSPLPHAHHMWSNHPQCERTAAVHTQFKRWKAYRGSVPGSPGGSWVWSTLLPSEVNTQAGTCCSCGCEARRRTRWEKSDDSISLWNRCSASLWHHRYYWSASRETEKKTQQTQIYQHVYFFSLDVDPIILDQLDFGFVCNTATTLFSSFMDTRLLAPSGRWQIQPVQTGDILWVEKKRIDRPTAVAWWSLLKKLPALIMHHEGLFTERSIAVLVWTGHVFRQCVCTHFFTATISGTQRRQHGQ